jgi:hypothetical protein
MSIDLPSVRHIVDETDQRTAAIRDPQIGYPNPFGAEFFGEVLIERVLNQFDMNSDKSGGNIRVNPDDLRHVFKQATNVSEQ